MPLTLNFAPGLAPHRPSAFHLPLRKGHGHAQHGDDDESFVINLTSVLHSNNLTSRIYTGFMRRPGLRYDAVSNTWLTDADMQVVCKLSFMYEGMSRLAWEALIYQHLRDLQAEFVPECFGYFEEQGYAGCLVLEYAGEPLATYFAALETPTKKKIMEAFTEIHDLGIEHGDVMERNVLLNPIGRVSVIDFGDATTVPCPRHLDIPAFGQLAPHRHDFACFELFDLGSALRMWRPATVLLYGVDYPVSALNNPQETIAQRPQRYSLEQATELVHYALMTYIARWFPDVYALIPKDGQRHWPTFNASDGDDELDRLASRLSTTVSLGDQDNPLNLDQLTEYFGTSLKVRG